MVSVFVPKIVVVESQIELIIILFFTASFLFILFGVAQLVGVLAFLIIVITLTVRVVIIEAIVVIFIPISIIFIIIIIKIIIPIVKSIRWVTFVRVLPVVMQVHRIGDSFLWSTEGLPRIRLHEADCGVLVLEHIVILLASILVQIIIHW